MKFQFLMLVLGALSLLPLLGMALSADKLSERTEGKTHVYPVAGSTTIYAGSLVSLNSSGFAIPAADTASTTFVGVAAEAADNSGSATNGAINVTVWRTGVFKFPATSITQAHVGSIMYVKDDTTFDNTSSNLIPCGRLVEYISATSGLIAIDSAIVFGGTIAASAASFGDSGNKYTATTVEAALTEVKLIADANKVSLTSAYGFIDLPLAEWLESSGTAVVGRLLANTTPALDMANGDTDSGLLLTWTAANSDAIMQQFSIPPDMDLTQPMLLELYAKEGANTDHPVMSADTYFNTGDTKVEDDSAAITNTTFAKYTITVAAADIPSDARTCTVELTPAAHASSNNSVVISDTRIRYTKKLLAA